MSLLAASFLSAREVPRLRGRVNDLARLMPAERARALEERLKRFEQETDHQIAVLTISSLEGEDLEGFSIKVAERWKIGKKAFDNGAILIVVKNDRKLRIEVGYGLEGILPDALASRIIREIIVPRFRNNDYAGGIEAGSDAIMRATRGEAIPASERKGSAQGEVDLWVSVVFSAFTVMTLALFAGIFLGIFSAFIVPGLARSPTRQRLVGGIIGGAVAAPVTSAMFAAHSQWMWLILMVALGALVGAQVVRVLWRSLTEARTSTAWSRAGYDRSHSWGSTSYSGSRSSSSGSGSSGSGFSGGGGSFGGGGASGSW